MKNAQLWKRILHEGCTYGIPEWRQESTAIERRIIRSTSIVDTRVRDEDVNDDKPFQWDSYRNVSWPFDEFWIEYQTNKNQLYGALLKIREGVATRFADQAPQGFRFSVELDYATYFNNERVLLIGKQTAFLNENRQLITDQLNDNLLHICANAKLVKTFGWQAFTNNIGVLFESILDTLLMLSCSNISISPRENSNKDVRTAVNRYGSNATGYRYHVLVVRPPGAKPDTPGQEIGNMPRHVCRGHFAEYGPEYGKGLLFGKLAGRFYIPPHVKGDAKSGIVEKDYEVTL